MVVISTIKSSSNVYLLFFLSYNLSPRCTTSMSGYSKLSTTTRLTLLDNSISLDELRSNFFSRSVLNDQPSVCIVLLTSFNATSACFARPNWPCKLFTGASPSICRTLFTASRKLVRAAITSSSFS